MGRFMSYFKENIILSLAVAGAFASMATGGPAETYGEYMNWTVLSILFCFMTVVGGFREEGVFAVFLSWLLVRIGTTRRLSGVLIYICFFVSMWVTNDVALITLVPFALLALRKVADEKEQALVIVLLTVAANLGSMCTPVGNPQNLYLYFHYGMKLDGFLHLLLPYSMVSLCLLTGSLFFLPDRKIPDALRLSSGKIGKLQEYSLSIRLILLCGLFILSFLTVSHVLDYRLSLGAVIISVALARPRYFKYVDGKLLLTFAAFFILIGNLSQWEPFKALLASLLENHEFFAALLLSQVISNVPAAVLLSGFTDKASLLLLGTDIGGLGTLIASMASLISYGFYVRTCPRFQGYYLKVFTFINVLYLSVLVLGVHVLQQGK